MAATDADAVGVAVGAAETTCFISPDHTGRGIGSRLLAHLEEQGAKRGIRNLLAAVSSLNSGSIPFHQRHGFTECGRFRHICRKKGGCYDVVWLQKEPA